MNGTILLIIIRLNIGDNPQYSLLFIILLFTIKKTKKGKTKKEYFSFDIVDNLLENKIMKNLKEIISMKDKYNKKKKIKK